MMCRWAHSGAAAEPHGAAQVGDPRADPRGDGVRAASVLPRCGSVKENIPGPGKCRWRRGNTGLGFASVRASNGKAAASHLARSAVCPSPVPLTLPTLTCQGLDANLLALFPIHELAFVLLFMAFSIYVNQVGLPGRRLGSPPLLCARLTEHVGSPLPLWVRDWRSTLAPHRHCGCAIGRARAHWLTGLCRRLSMGW